MTVNDIIAPPKIAAAVKPAWNRGASTVLHTAIVYQITLMYENMFETAIKNPRISWSCGIRSEYQA
jgi:hypothetical protein